MTPPKKIHFRALLTMTGESYENGTLSIEDGRIKSIFPNFSSDPGPDLLDLSDHLILPGFVNAHCHLALSCLRGKLKPKPKFTDWVRDLLKVNPTISNEERIREMRLGADELLKSGVTTLADYLAPAELIDEFESLAFRQVLFLETLGFKSADSSRLAEQVRAILKNSNPQNPRIELAVSAHAPYSVSPELFRSLKSLADEFGRQFSCHVAEFAEEVRFLQAGGGEMQNFLEERGAADPKWTPPGKSPVQYLESLGQY